MPPYDVSYIWPARQSGSVPLRTSADSPPSPLGGPVEFDRRTALALGTVGVATAGLSTLSVASAGESGVLAGPVTETMLLTGADADHTVDWDFQVTAGRRAGEWGTIPTPSNWECHGFGSYHYGGDLVPAEKGNYRHTVHAARVLGRAPDLPGVRGRHDRRRRAGQRRFGGAGAPGWLLPLPLRRDGSAAARRAEPARGDGQQGIGGQLGERRRAPRRLLELRRDLPAGVAGGLPGRADRPGRGRRPRGRDLRRPRHARRGDRSRPG